MCRSDARTSATNPSAVLCLQLGTLCLLLSSTVTLSLYLNLSLKLTCSILPYLFRQRLWSYGTIALYKCVIIISLLHLIHCAVNSECVFFCIANSIPITSHWAFSMVTMLWLPAHTSMPSVSHVWCLCAGKTAACLMQSLWLKLIPKLGTVEVNDKPGRRLLFIFIIPAVTFLVAKHHHSLAVCDEIARVTSHCDNKTYQS